MLYWFRMELFQEDVKMALYRIAAEKQNKIMLEATESQGKHCADI